MLGSALNTECCVLFGDYVVFIVGIEWLMLWRNIDFFCRKLSRAGEVFQEVGVVRGV